MFIEIFIYLVIAFGILVVCITMLEKDEFNDEKCIIMNKEKIKIKLVVETEGVSDDDVKKIAYIIRRGKYVDIYDIVTSYEVINKDILLG